MPAERLMHAKHGQAGFTLLEVIVALVIATLALSGLFAGAATGLRSSHLSGDYIVALSQARSHLAALGQGGPLVPGVRSGEDGSGFRWQVRIAPLAGVPFVGHQPQAAEASPSQVELLAVAVTISWQMDGGQRHIELQTQRIGLAAPTGP